MTAVSLNEISTATCTDSVTKSRQQFTLLSETLHFTIGATRGKKPPSRPSASSPNVD